MSITLAYEIAAPNVCPDTVCTEYRRLGPEEAVNEDLWAFGVECWWRQGGVERTLQ